MVHEALRVIGSEVVEPLSHAGTGQRGEAEHLGLAALEEAGAVRAGDEVDLGRERTQVGVAATVRAHTIVEDAAPDEALFERLECFLVRFRIRVLVKVVEQGRLDGGPAAVAVGLVFCITKGRGQVIADAFLDRSHDVGFNRLWRVLAFRRRYLGGQRFLHLADRRDRFLADGQRLDQHRLGDLAGLGFDHRDRVLGAGDDEVEVGDFELREGWLEDQLAVDVPDPHRGDRSVEGDVGDAERGRCRNRAQRVGRVLHIDREDRNDQLGVVVVTLGE